MQDIIVAAHNIRSTHNIGSIFRTCEGFGVEHLVLSGYSPYPTIPDDTRLPHVSSKVTARIAKTALGAESLVPFSHSSGLSNDLERYKKQGYKIVGLEQASGSTPLQSFVAPQKVVLILGEEVRGIDPALLKLCDQIIEIPMFGQKESFNVSVAFGIALYQLVCK
jgi:tRNA G18 (ribose-2'-O)-methylase SpoU